MQPCLLHSDIFSLTISEYFFLHICDLFVTKVWDRLISKDLSVRVQKVQKVRLRVREKNSKWIPKSFLKYENVLQGFNESQDVSSQNI